MLQRDANCKKVKGAIQARVGNYFLRLNLLRFSQKPLAKLLRTLGVHFDGEIEHFAAPLWITQATEANRKTDTGVCLRGDNRDDVLKRLGRLLKLAQFHQRVPDDRAILDVARIDRHGATGQFEAPRMVTRFEGTFRRPLQHRFVTWGNRYGLRDVSIGFFPLPPIAFHPRKHFPCGRIGRVLLNRRLQSRDRFRNEAWIALGSLDDAFGEGQPEIPLAFIRVGAVFAIGVEKHEREAT